MSAVRRLTDLHAAAFGRLQSATDDWVSGAVVRFAFAAVLLGYFWNAALRKVEPGVAGFFSVRDGAYAQILPKTMEAVLYDVTQVGVLGHLVVYAGTYAEFVLPLLIVVGLLTRLAALGMIGFTLVMSYVDVVGHGADAATFGAWFDRLSGAAILDQRTLWVALLLILVVRGPGLLSLDHVLGRLVRGDRARGAAAHVAGASARSA